MPNYHGQMTTGVEVNLSGEDKGKGPKTINGREEIPDS